MGKELTPRVSHSARRPRGTCVFKIDGFIQSGAALDCERFERSRFRNSEVFGDLDGVVTALEQIV